MPGISASAKIIGHVGTIATSLAGATNAVLLEVALALCGASFPLAPYLLPGNGLLVQLLALGGLIAGGGVVYLAVAQQTGAANYRALLRSVARG